MIHRFKQQQLVEVTATEPAVRPESFVAIPIGVGAMAVAAQSPSVYEIARQAALREQNERKTRDQQFRKFLDRALFSSVN